MNDPSRNERRKRFVRRYKFKIVELLESRKKTGEEIHKMLRGQKFAEFARKHLTYARTTSAHDIVAGILRTFRGLLRK